MRDLERAATIYEELIRLQPARPYFSNLGFNRGDDRIRMLHAQCLAHLGRRDEAARLAEEVLKQAPDDVQVLHQATQLYALLGERLSAL